MGTQPKFDLGMTPDAELEKKPCAIDFLFVVDNSGSMADEQENLRRSVPDFIHTVKHEVKSLEGYHIGVTVTDHNWGNPKECRKIGALVTRTRGAQSSNKVCGPYAEGHNYMTQKDDLQTAFGCASKPGIGGRGDERPIDAIRGALSEELLKPGQCNAGFLRKDALLVVTLITDEEDDHIDPSLPGSAGDPPQWYKDLLAAKGNDPRKIVVLGLIGTEDSKCTELVGADKAALGNSGAQISKRLQSFVQMFGKRGFVGDVCAPNYGPFFKKAVSVIDAACDELPPG